MNDGEQFHPESDQQKRRRDDDVDSKTPLLTPKKKRSHEPFPWSREVGEEKLVANEIVNFSLIVFIAEFNQNQRCTDVYRFIRICRYGRDRHW
jgi:hypothetical protein